MKTYTKPCGKSTGTPQLALRTPPLKWVAEAAARAEERLGGEPTHPTPLKAFDQVQKLIGAILDPRIKRIELREIAKAISEGRA